jgi:hypothetical protein
VLATQKHLNFESCFENVGILEVQDAGDKCPFIIFGDNGGHALVCTSASYRLQSVPERGPPLLSTLAYVIHVSNDNYLKYEQLSKFYLSTYHLRTRIIMMTGSPSVDS